MVISSMQNPLIRQILKLDKARNRKKERTILVEGLREIRMAIKAGFEVRNILYTSSTIDLSKLMVELEFSQSNLFTEVTDAVFDQLVYRKGIANAFALLVPKFRELEEITLNQNPFILVVDAVEKPGNLGAMLRTADAAGVDEIIVCDPQTDLYNPNCIRSSLGAVFTRNVTVTTIDTCIDWLKKNQINTFITYLESANSYLEENYTLPTAIVLGSEAFGIRETWLNQGFKNIIIPQHGFVDSMNVSASSAILIFEVLRQRLALK